MNISNKTQPKSASNGMNIFNSLGSNYNFATALRILFSLGGPSARRLEQYLERKYKGRVILTYKGREALALALHSLPEKSSVAMNGFTCLAVYEAIVGSEHSVRYLDIPQSGLEFSIGTFREAIDAEPKITAVIVQNTLGIPYHIRPLAELCRARGIVLIEDLAHSIGAQYASGEEVGTVGDFVVLSFSQDKVVDAVAGGALIVRNNAYAGNITPPTNTVSMPRQLKDRIYPILTWKIRYAYRIGIGPIFHALVRALRLLSTPLGEETSFARKLPGWYCANILRQFERLDEAAKHREEIAKIYAVHLDAELLFQNVFRCIPHSSNLRFPIFIHGRERLLAHLKTHGVHVADIWYDAPIAPRKYLHRTNYQTGACPRSEHTANRIVNLPTHVNVSHDDARAIAGLINEWVRADVRAPYAVRTVTSEEAWERFLRQQHAHSFLHSWKWGHLHDAGNSKVFRIGVYKNSDLVAAALLIKTDARRGRFLLCPHGPVVAPSEHVEQLLRLIVDEATRLGRSEGCDFLRFCPLSEPSEKNISIYRYMGFRDAPIHMHPELAWILDITKSENELLKEMRKTTRYLIKKMEKEGVEIIISANPDDIEKFWPVYESTVERQHFTPFKKDDLRKEFELFAKDNGAAFFFGSQGGGIVAAAIIIFYNGQAFYHHSGSMSSGSNVSYLLQWRVIQEAKTRGCTLYNFWGISPPYRPDHPWAGLSLFKKGFGGFAEEYLHAQDKPLSAKYGLNYLVETARRIKRGL